MARMQETPAVAQEEARSERVAIAITPSEKRAIRAVAALRGTDESNLIRVMTIADIVAEFGRVQRAAEEVA